MHGTLAAVSDKLFDKADCVVVGKVLGIDNRSDSTSSELEIRTFTYQILIEAVEKGNLKRGDTIQLKAWVGNSLEEKSSKPLWSDGYSLLPLAGERGRFFLSISKNTEYEILFPDGVELDPAADKADPRRIGDQPIEVTQEEIANEPRPTSKDPFGWDVILILLGIPFIVGAVRQKSRSRWGLLVVGALMFLGAAIITSWT